MSSKKAQEVSSLVAQPVKDLALSLLRHGFDPRPGTFHTAQALVKKKKKILKIYGGGGHSHQARGSQLVTTGNSSRCCWLSHLGEASRRRLLLASRRKRPEMLLNIAQNSPHTIVQPKMSTVPSLRNPDLV